MTRNLYIFPHNTYSESVKVLSTALGGRRIKHEGSCFSGASHKTVINWGCGSLPVEVTKCKVINSAQAVNICANKLAFFRAVDNKCNTPDWTDDDKTALGWVEDGQIIFARTTLRGNGGKGIVEIDTLDDMIKAPLYTKYIPKKEEYRVHILDGKVFLVQRKALSGDADPDFVNWHIRNLDNGFIFARNEGKVPENGVVEEALKAFKAIKDLTFGSADIIYNKYRKKAYVLEINTASGLQGSTVDDYANAFKEYLNV